MKVSASFLSIKENIKENIKKLDNTNIDYLHLDIMDGKFVQNKTWNVEEINDLLIDTKKPKDVHLMVKDVCSYVDDFAKINPEFITFHYEAVTDPHLIIDYIKSYNIKVGISIKPNTDVSILDDLLDFIDLVLIMSVEPGKGGQEFIENTFDKLKYLREKQKNHHFVIEVDGGINDSNIKKIDADMVVVGSFITNSDNYDERIKKITLN